jgi:3-oxoacyl-[acyl-carrier protein] reductase
MANAGGEVQSLAADPSRDDECDRLFAWATSTLGELDILVNNTVGPPTGGVPEVSEDQWRESFDLIFMSALRLSRAAIPVMREGGGGSIVNLVSLIAKQPIGGSALSNALRPALIGTAKTLSREAAPEVRVNKHRHRAHPH